MSMSFELNTPLADQAADVHALYVYDGEFNYNNGLTSYVRTLGEYMMGQEADVTYLVGRDSIQDPHAIALGRTMTFNINGSRADLPLPTSRQKIRDTLDDIQPDVLHVQMPYVPLMAGRVLEAAQGDARVVGTFHTVADSFSTKIGNHASSLLNRKTLPKFDELFSVSTAAQASARKIFGVDSEVLGCPIDVAAYREGKRLPEYDDGKTNIVFIGKLVERKGAENLVNALTLVDKNLLKNVRVLIGGDGYLRESLEDTVQKHGLADSVTFLGEVSAGKPDLLASADIAVYPTNGAESFGIVLTEAMAARSGAVIASNNAGYSEVLNGNPAALFNPESPEDLASRLVQLIIDKDQRNDLFQEQQGLVMRYDVATKIGPRLLRAYGVYPQIMEGK